MKRLVTQFDTTRTRATVATPTCCCCCCCVGTILTATAVTAMNAHELVGQTQMSEGRRWVFRVAAFLALPLAVLISIAGGLLFGLVGPDVGFVAAVIAFFGGWAAVLMLLYRTIGLTGSTRVVVMTVVLCTVLFCLEFVGAVMLIFTDELGGWLYLALAVALPFGAVPLLRRWMRR